MTDTAAALTAAEARKLGQWAKKSHNQSLSWLRGYLFSLAALPMPLPSHVWLTQLKADGVEPLLTQQFEVLAADIGAGTPKLPSGCALKDDARDNFQQGNPLNDWSRGFDDAMTVVFPLWEEVLPKLEDSVAESLDACWCMMSFFADLSEAAELAQHNQMPLAELCQATRTDLPHVLKSYAVLSSDIRRELGDAMQSEGMDLAAMVSDSPAQDDVAMDELEQLLSEAVEAEQLEKRSALLEVALVKAEQHLGQAAFEKHQGHFWQVPETRPFMQTLALITECYQMQGELQQAIEHAERALKLCPTDNLGIRYPLIGMLLETQQYTRVHALMEQFDEASVFFHYSRALLGYIEQRDSLKAASAKRKAVKANPHFVEMLRKNAPIPDDRAPYYSPGDENEAIMLLEFMGNAWHNVDGAVRWLCAKRK